MRTIRIKATVGFAVGVGLAIAAVSSAAAATPHPRFAPALGAPIYAFDTQWVLTASGHVRPGAKVTITRDRGQAGQRWLLRSDGSVRPAADHRLCLSVQGPKSKSRQLKVWTCGNAATQRFTQRSPSAHSPVEFITTRTSRRQCLTSGLYPRAPVVVQRCHGSDTQAWATTQFAPSNSQYPVGTIDPDYGSALAAVHAVRAGSQTTINRLDGSLNQYWVTVPTGPFPQADARTTLHPLDNTSLCLTRIGPEAAGAGLRLARCRGLESQQFIGIQIGHTIFPAWAMLLSPDARYCVAVFGKVPHRNAELARCTGRTKDEWYVDVNLTTGVSYQFDDLYLGDPAKTPTYEAMDAPNFGRAGTKIVLHLEQGNLDSPAQVWTDLAPGASAGGNADGSFSVRPLYNLRLCLTVPRADDTAGVQLEVQACDGKPDQEFSRATSPISPGISSDQTLSPFADRSLCVGVNGTISKGKPVKLLPCRDTASQNWTNQSGWYGWAA